MLSIHTYIYIYIHIYMEARRAVFAPMGFLAFPSQGSWKQWLSRDLENVSPGCESPGLVIPKH